MKAGAMEEIFQCENRMGMFESIAKLFTNKYAEIDHPKCMHKGDHVCHYIISWEKQLSLVWKRVRNYALLFSVLILLAGIFWLHYDSWMLLATFCVLLSLFFFYYYERIEKKELQRVLEAQGEAAENYMESLNLRYNNALLIQEIGQAISHILDTEKLVSAVTSIMKKRLDFDRGIIMLAEKSNIRLVYAGGYGYTTEQEETLSSTEFNLDNTRIKGGLWFGVENPKTLLVE